MLPSRPPAAGSSSSKASSKAAKKSSKSPAKSSAPSLQTPLDLELDLAAQQTKLKVLQDEIDRLREIKSRLEQEKGQGSRELPAWLQENDQFQQMIAHAQSTEGQDRETSREERKVEKLMRKTDRDIYKLRKTRTVARGRVDEQAFREKMAFVVTRKAEVPIVDADVADPTTECSSELSSGCSTLKQLDQERLSVMRDQATAVAQQQHQVTVQQRRKQQLSPINITSGPKTITTLNSENNTLTREKEGDDSTTERFTYEIDPEIGVIV